MKKLIMSVLVFKMSLFSTLPIMPTLEERYSGSLFDPEKSVTEEDLHTLAAAAQLSPSSYNEQPWVFIICDRNENPEAYDQALQTLVPFNQNWAKNAQVLVIVLYAKRFVKNDKENLWASYDTGAAVQSLSLQATYLGMITHQIGGFDVQKVKESFAIDETLEPISVIALGYPAQNEVKPPRVRKPLEKNFFKGSLEKPLFANRDK